VRNEDRKKVGYGWQQKFCQILLIYLPWLHVIKTVKGCIQQSFSGNFFILTWLNQTNDGMPKKSCLLSHLFSKFSQTFGSLNNFFASCIN
jgi:hypothetical protein